MIGCGRDMEMKRSPNDPCWCDSKRKYKKCHKAFDEAPEDRKYTEAQRLYANAWRVTSQLQYARGDYDWMAQQLKPYKVERLFDVGCGSGHGLLALSATLPAPVRVVAVDENRDCLRIARDTLAKAGLSPAVIARLDWAHTPLGFVHHAKPFAGPLPRPLALIEADPMTDPYLEEALHGDGPFDAVTIWLTGAHMWRRMNAVSRSRGVRDEHDLRILLQNNAYELADRILRPGGVLQVVDRAEAPTTDFLYNAYVQAHREQAEPTTLDVREIAYRLWSSPEGGGTKMIFTTPEGREAVEPEMALVSIISVKV
jgi:SAM-dependent methyltransferase